MRNLIHMDLYRMKKIRTCLICLALAFVFALLMTPALKLLDMLGTMLGGEASTFPKTTTLRNILSDPFPMLNSMLAMISLCSFFYADHEGGYIKNIAGQMPMRGFTVLSKFFASIVHNLVFALAGLAGSFIGTMLFQRITPDGMVLEGIRICLMRLLLLQGITAILLLVTGSFRSKPLGTVLSVLLGVGLLTLVYSGFEAALHQIPFLKDFTFSPYMPDQLLQSPVPGTLESLASAGVCIALFLPLAVRAFDHRDIK